MSRLELTFFGPFSATLDGQPVTHFRSSKVQALLIYVALNAGRAHARTQLATLLWPDEADTTAKHNLRQTLFRLRKVLGDGDTSDKPFLHVTRATVQFNQASRYTLDVDDFLLQCANNQLESGVSRYQGELLAGFDSGSGLFDEWLREERARYQQQVLDALHAVTADYLARGAFSAAQRFARRQLAMVPWHEGAHRQLMQALAAAGKRSAALAQFEVCRRVLADEFGAAPAPETQQLAANIRQTAAPHSESLAERRGPAQQRLMFPFVGRQIEFQLLTQALQTLEQDGMQVVTLMGKAGAGKTRLATQFSRWAAAQGVDVLTGRSFENSSGLSYQPIVQLLRQRLEQENAPEDLLSDFWLAQLSRLLPELRDRYPDLPLPREDPVNAQQHLFESATRLCQALATRRPLLLFIDDWQWADTASHDLLQYAAARWLEAKAPICVLLTLRQEAIAPATQSWLTSLRRTVPTATHQLADLSQLDIERLLALLLTIEMEATPPQLKQLSQWLFVETAGHALFLTETVKMLVADGRIKSTGAEPAWQADWSRLDRSQIRQGALTGIQAIVAEWMNRISEPARGVLTAAAVLGPNATFAHLCHLTELAELAAIDALDELIRKQLLLDPTTSTALLEPGGAYRFSHEKVSASVYAAAGAARRALLHRRALTTLRAADAPASESAFHAQRAGLIPETIQLSLEAGHAAMATFAAPVAQLHYDTAFQLVEHHGWPTSITHAERISLYAGMGRAFEVLAVWAKAEASYTKMLDYAQDVDDAQLTCRSLNLLASVYARGVHNNEKAAACLQQARAIAVASGDQRGLIETEMNLGLTARMEEKLYLTLQHAETALPLARALGDPQLLARCLVELGFISFPLRRIDDLEAYFTEAYQLARDTNQMVLAETCQFGIAWAKMAKGHAKQGVPLLRASVAFAQQIQSPWDETESSRGLAHLLVEVGDYGEALQHAAHAHQLAPRVGLPTMITMARLIQSIVWRATMSLDAAQELLTTLLADVLPQARPNITDWVAAELCAVYAMQRQWEKAHQYAKQSLLLRQENALPPMSTTGWFETEALLRGGDAAMARADIDFIAGHVGSNPRQQLPLLRSRAVLAEWDGNDAMAQQLLESALALAIEMELPGETWPIWRELSRLYASNGDLARARHARNEAATLIHRLAATIEDATAHKRFLHASQIQAVLKPADIP